MNLKIFCKYSDTRRSLKIKLKNKNSCKLQEHLYPLCFRVKFAIKRQLKFKF